MDINEQIKKLNEAKNNWLTKKYSLMAKEPNAIGNELSQIEQELDKANKKIAEIENEINSLKNQIEKPFLKEETIENVNNFSFETTKFSKKSKEKEVIDLYFQKGELNFDTSSNDYKDFLKIKDELDEMLQKIGVKNEKLIDSSLIHKNDFIYHLSDKIIFKEILTKEEEQQINSIRTDYKDEIKRFKWFDRSIIINSLVLSLAHNNKFDVKKATLLLDFLAENEENEDEQNWQRTLVGLVLILCKNHNKIKKYPLFIAKLKELQNLPKIQLGLEKIENILRNQHYKELPSFNFSNIPFFEMPQNWFIPFHTENELFKRAIDNASTSINIDELELYLKNIPYSNAYKYAICLFVEKGIIKEFPPLNKEEKKNWKEINNELLRLSLYFHPFQQLINEWYNFFSSYPQQKFNNLLEEKITIYETSLTDIILSQTNRNKFSAALDIKNKRWSVAITKLEKVLEFNSKEEEVLYNCAICHTELKHFNEAIKYWEQLEKLLPENNLATINIGICYFHAENYKKSLKYLVKEKKAIIENNKQILNIIAICYTETEEYEKAIEFYKELEKLDMTNSDVKLMIGNCYWEKDYMNESIDYYLKANELQKNDFNILNNICGAYGVQKDYINAEKYGKLAEKINRNGNLINLARLYYELNDLNKCINYLNHSLKVSKNSETLAIAVNIYFNLGDFNNAKKYVEEYLKITKKYDIVVFLISISIKYIDENQEEAIKEFKDLFENVKSDDKISGIFDKIYKGFESKGFSKEDFEQLKNKVLKK